MKFPNEFRIARDRILGLLEHPDEIEEGKKRSKIYRDYLDLSLSRASIGKVDGMKLGGAAVLLLLAVICFFMRGGVEGLAYKIYIGIAAVACIGGFIFGSFVGVIAVALLFALVKIAIEKFGLLLAIVFFIAAIVVLLMALREASVNKVRQESKIRLGIPALEKDFMIADREFKFELISRFAKLAEAHSLTVDEYRDEATRFAQKLIGHYPGEIEGHTYDDVQMMVTRAIDDRMKLNPNYIKNDGLSDPNRDLPFLLYPEYSFYDAQNGLTLSGKIVHGRVSRGDTLEIVGNGITDRTAVVSKIKTREGGKTVQLERADHGEVSLQFPDLKKTDFVKGSAVATVGSIRLTDYFKAKVQILEPEKGEAEPIYNGTLWLLQTPEDPLQSLATINFMGLKDEARPGEELFANIDLGTPLPLELHADFSMSDEKKKRTILLGSVVDLYQNQ